MDFWNRLLGTTITPKKPPKPANDPTARLNTFKRVYNTILELCDRPRNLATEAPLLDELNVLLARLVALLRHETRAPVPHVCFRFAASKQIYAAIARAATVSQYEPVIRSSIAVFVSLADSEEEDFLASEHFAKCLMRLVRKVIESGEVLVDTDTETSILELLFTIAAKIRLQPDILPVWFQSTANPDLEDVFVREKKSFVGITQKDDFPLCYIFIERVHHEGRIGDFARTGLLYIFEATGRSLDLEEWVLSSDLPTLMASGLGALYSQLSRELSILHADAELPAVLAMSDYSTTHPRATAESSFSQRHTSHMTTFLSYLAFWQDLLDHCRSADVKQTLLDHFQILFLQQLLYPSILQSSATDAGSSVAVLTYMNAVLDALEYPDLLHMILIYLLAIEDGTSAPYTPAKADQPPRSPTTIRRRQSLMLLSAPKNPDDAVEPILFNLVDLITTNVESNNSQSVFAALKLASTLITRHRKYAFGSLLKVDKVASRPNRRTIGAFEKEIDQYSHLAASIHPHYSVDTAYTRLSEDTRYVIESQVPALPTAADNNIGEVYTLTLLDNDPLLRSMLALLRTFFTNSVDVNLGLTQAIISIAQCVEIRLDSWIALTPSTPSTAVEPSLSGKAWQTHLDGPERETWAAMSTALQTPSFNASTSPILYKEIATLLAELDTVRTVIPNFDQLMAGRKVMLQAAPIDHSNTGEASSIMDDPNRQPQPLEVSRAVGRHSRAASRSGRGRAGDQLLSPSNTGYPTPRIDTASATASPTASRTASKARVAESSASAPGKSMYKPPPPETPSTTDILMQVITFTDQSKEVNVLEGNTGEADEASEDQMPMARKASLNHILTNVVILQEFVLEILAVIQIRAAVLGEKEIRHS
ncbi:uncharacterized protein MYCFIDRAFT_152627 [Pseudocercospora fijiensis CIRAD86]|uniref:Retinoic acid induced 16-like protein n=1 Tax=Pseudocercospora fijiensis (strain CIRAD86) TaxID=383855 RepID=M2ZZR7_PSEFD|nr:uncharacterized protein MYCFIDRAFT_152627 [Pseudocercospora fijiensis CIRAD86]EME84404.1 hypothetical protein MYCFIDRAFT_152627 [Pseudocercospora fijiensis CIRAD86]